MRHLGIHLDEFTNSKSLHPSYLGFSSSVYRCQESLKETIREFVQEIPVINNVTIRSLDYNYVYKSPYVLNNLRDKVNFNLMEDEQIASMFGVGRLFEVLNERYNIRRFDDKALNILATIRSEMALNESANPRGQHYDWIYEVVAKDNQTGNVMTLMDVFNQVVLLGYYKQLDQVANFITTGPIIESLFESQKTILRYRKLNWRYSYYSGKNVILYSTHDTTILRVLKDLGIVRLGNPAIFRQRFFDFKSRPNVTDLHMFLNGFMMSHPGFSARFELWSSYSKKVVRLSIYHDVDKKNINYEAVPLGYYCSESMKKSGYITTEIVDPFECPVEVFWKLFDVLPMIHYKEYYNGLRHELERPRIKSSDNMVRTFE